MCSGLSFFVLFCFVCTNAVSLDILLLFLPEMATVDHHYPCSTVLEVTRIQWPQHKMFFIYLFICFIYLFWHTPAWSRVQALLFSNIICKGIALSFFLPMVCIHVCHVFQVGHTMPSREREGEAECSRCVA